MKGNFPCEYAETHQQPGLRAGYVQHLEQRIGVFILITHRSSITGLTHRGDFLEGRLSSVEEQLQHFLRSPPRERFLHDRNEDGTVDAPYPENGSYEEALGIAEVDGSRNLDAPDEAVSAIAPSLRNERPTLADSHNLDPLSHQAVTELCRVWFEKYHRFFPILHQPSFTQLLTQTDNVASSRYGLVAQAIIAVTLQHSSLLVEDAIQRQQWQEQLCTAVVVDCIRTSSLQSIQALLVLSSLQYGEGKFMQSWNFLAMARRMGSHLSLSQPVNEDNTPGMSPTALRRLPTYTNTTVEDEEKIRAYWMIETLDSISTIGVRFDTGRPSASQQPLLPCSDSYWAYPEPILADANIRPYNYCSAFSLCVILGSIELTNVHKFLQRGLPMDTFEERDAWQVEAQRLDERLTAWRDEFVAAVFRLINAEYTHHERAEMDAYVVLTNCVLNTAVITLLQQRASCPAGVEQTPEPWPFANNRCVYASENTAFKVRQMDEDELSVCHPHLIFSIFVAARFYIVHSKALDANVPTNLHSLAFALHVCGKRWPLARMYEHIIRVAVAEYRTPVVQSRVPRGFYNLRLTTFEISDTLVAWAEGPGANISLSIDGQGDYSGVMSFTPMTVDVLA